MLVIQGRNVNWNYSSSIDEIYTIGEYRESRNGPVLVAPCPVMTVTERPMERVLFDQNRDANPFFHFFECLWMMSGSNDGRWLDRFVSDFSSRYAEDDGRIHGAYGHRWRHWGGFCQLSTAIELLREDPSDRRVVISMWDPGQDLAESVRDVPCNTHMYPRVRSTDSGAVLDLTVCCRSNDIVWGATGANAVHFSFLQEWMAAQIGVGVGRMYQLSNNWHAYTATLEKIGEPRVLDLYTTGDVAPYQICQVPEAWDEDLNAFMHDPLNVVFFNAFFSEVVRPMWLAHTFWKSGERQLALQATETIAATDWRQAVRAWMQRRIDRAKK